VQDIETLGALVAGDHVAERVIAHMAHMDAPGWVGEHRQYVVLFTVCIFVRGKGFTVGPALLPFGFCCFGVVACHAFNCGFGPGPMGDRGKELELQVVGANSQRPIR